MDSDTLAACMTFLLPSTDIIYFDVLAADEIESMRNVKTFPAGFIVNTDVRYVVLILFAL